MPMSQERAVNAVAWMGKIFPRWKTTPELNSLWVDLFVRHDAATVTTVIEAHRRVRKGNDPCMDTIGGMLDKAARQAQAVARGGSAPVNWTEEGQVVEPSGMTWPEYADWALRHGKYQGEDQRADLEMIARGQPSGYPSVARLMHGGRLPGVGEVAAALPNKSAWAPQTKVGFAESKQRLIGEAGKA